MSTSLLERTTAPVLDPVAVQSAAETFLAALAHDAHVRERYLAAGHDEPAVATLITEVTGIAVCTDDLPAIAQHLVANESGRLDDLGRNYPQMNFILFTTH